MTLLSFPSSCPIFTDYKDAFYEKNWYNPVKQVQIQRGDRGSGPPPPGKSQVIWVSIGNKQLDPLEKNGPPPPLENVGPPLEP